MNGEGTMMRAHADHRTHKELNEMARLDRLRHILEIVEAGDEPPFDFYAHEHQKTGNSSTSGADPHVLGPSKHHLSPNGSGDRVIRPYRPRPPQA